MVNLSPGRGFLAEQGLNLLAILALETLPPAVQSQLSQANIPWQNYSHIGLTGMGGTKFWHVLQQQTGLGEHPVDEFSEKITRQWLAEYMGNPPLFWLYPADYLIPLQTLGEYAGWAFPSPLGLGISPVYGVWFAYRSAFLLRGDFPEVREPIQTSPCDSCEEKPCLTACPAAAVRGVHQFNISACCQHRLSPGSSCADRCLSRLACPVAPEHRYSLAQIQYHYGYSRTTLKAYFNGLKNRPGF